MENTKAIQKVDNWKSNYIKLAEQYEGVNASDIQLMHKTVAKDTTLTEFRYFLNVSKASGLNPFLKEIWCYKDSKGNQIIFAGRDGFLKKAQENSNFAGIRSCEVRVNDEFAIDVANNKIHHKVTTLSDQERGEITGAYAIAFRKDGEPTIELVSWKTYNKGYNTWKSHPAEMIKKVAEVHALKKAFGISELQIEEDFTIRGGEALPLGAEASSEKIKDSEIAEAIGDVYKNMLKRIDLAKSEFQIKKIGKDIEKQVELGLLSKKSIEELNMRYEAKLNTMTKDGE